MKYQHVALVTGTLAAPSLRAVARQLNQQFGISTSVIVLNIQVAALMTAPWVLRKLQLPQGNDSKPGVVGRPDLVILPGYCHGQLGPIAEKLGVPVEVGPKDLHDLPLRFGSHWPVAQMDKYTIEIIAEINHASRLTMRQAIEAAEVLRGEGADVIDIGCDPGVDRPQWNEVGSLIAELRDRGMRISVDSFHPREVQLACGAGAELVLSVNSTNCQAASDWGVEVVVVPDNPHDLQGLDETIGVLDKDGVSFRIDPVIEPIGFGFAQSLGRYLQVRQRYPQAPMMMGVGNLSEMTGVDSAGINMLLIGICQELNIQSVLTTQVINWARSSVKEIDLARRIMHRAVNAPTVPKHIDERLVMLRDSRLRRVDEEELERLAAQLKDDNIRIFADPERAKLYALNKSVYTRGDDPFLVFDQLNVDDPSHAFYLGYEMAKAMTAITLAKNYTQDEPLDWGMLTRKEASHYERRTKENRHAP